MRNAFVPTQNVGRFLKAAKEAADRSAAEKRIVVIAGEAGLGKSRTALWWAVHHSAVMIQAHPAVTPAWLLRDLARELGQTLRRSTEAQHGTLVRALIEDPRPIVLDEVEHAIRRDAVGLDALRQLVDLVEVPLILVGREGTPGKLQAHRQIWRRIGAVADFRPLDLGDVRLLAEKLVEATLPDAVLAAVHAASKGLMDGVIDGLGRAEAAAKRVAKEGRDLAPDDVPGLGHPWARKEAEIVGIAGRGRRKAAA